ncbi:MAG: glutathione peroxidase [Planctomycetota bacterium]
MKVSYEEGLANYFGLQRRGGTGDRLVLSVRAKGNAGQLLSSEITFDSFNTPIEANSDLDPALNYKMKSIDGAEVDLNSYKGKVVLVVNVASKCGLTGQYKQLQELHDKYADKGLVILGFPCNQYLGQEPGSEEQIKTFCETKYGVKFPMFANVDVNGDGACALYKQLTSLELPPVGKGAISWNFEKFLLNREGQPIARFSPRTKPDDAKVIEAIKMALGK